MSDITDRFIHYVMRGLTRWVVHSIHCECDIANYQKWGGPRLSFNPSLMEIATLYSHD